MKPIYFLSNPLLRAWNLTSTKAQHLRIMQLLLLTLFLNTGIAKNIYPEFEDGPSHAIGINAESKALMGPDIAIVGGNLNGLSNQALICSGSSSGLSANTTMIPATNVGYIVTSVQSNNCTNLYITNDIIGFGLGVAINAPTLSNGASFGFVTYELTAFEDVNSNQIFDSGDIGGEMQVATILVEPAPTFNAFAANSTTPLAQPLEVCENTITGNYGDVLFDLSSTAVPGTNSFIRYTLNTVSVSDPNTTSAQLTTLLEGMATLPMDYNGSPGSAHTRTISDAILLAAPQNFQVPITITYNFTASIVRQLGSGNTASCGTHNMNIEVLVIPSNTVNIGASQNYFCHTGSLNLNASVTGYAGNPNSFSWSIPYTDPGVSASFSDPTAQNPVLYSTLNTNTIPQGNFGQIVVRVTLTDANGCTDQAQSTIKVMNCVPPSVSIADPCSCRDSIPGAQGNATTLADGQFNETVEVTAPTGQSWYIVSQRGFYMPLSFHPPAEPIAYLPGMPLMEDPLNPGTYTLDGVHIDAQGYALVVANTAFPVADTLTIRNTCYYPNPAIDNFLSSYCSNESTILLSGNADADDLDTFNIYNSNTNVLIQADASAFSPSVLGVGDYTVEYVLDHEPNVVCATCDTPGCISKIEVPVEVVLPNTSLACNNHINFSLDDDCEVVVLPDDVLEGTYPNYDIFEVMIFDRGRNIGNTLNRSHIGKTLEVRVYDRCTNNMCWGTATVEDKKAPIIDCSNPTLTNTLTGSLDVTDGIYHRIVPFTQGEDPASCVLSNAFPNPPGSANVQYDVINFTITTPGTYTFDMVNHDFSPYVLGTSHGFGSIYEYGFDPNEPCRNLIAADADSHLPFNYGPKLTVTLLDVPGNYSLVTSSFYSGMTGPYTWTVNGPQTNNVPAPIVTSNTDTITITCVMDPNDVAPPIAWDNCSQPVVPQLVGETFETFGCGRTDGTVKIISRTWRATDDYGNMSNTCQQHIKIVKKGINDVVFPRDTVLDCTSPITAADPDLVGWPTIDGIDVLPGNLCQINVGYNDVDIPICGNSKKVLREWTVMDWCQPLVPGVNPRVYQQLIVFMDQTPPTYNLPAVLEASTDPDRCTATVVFPSVVTSDDCSGVSVQISTPYGVVHANGGVVDGFPIGDYDVTYTFTDGCGNSTSAVTVLKVTDQIEPVAICIEFLAITLTTAGYVEVPATSFDAGSYDNCGIDRFEVARMDQGIFGPTVTFDCNDADSMRNVIVKVIDFYGNENTCMVEAEIADKLAPIVIGPAPVVLGCQEDPYDLNVTGRATATDGCPIVSVDSTTNDMRDRCGVGTLIRTFTATDQSGNTSSYRQVITVVNDNPFNPATIAWPLDTTFLNDCGRGLHPDSLAAGYDYPTWPDIYCADIMSRWEDDKFHIIDPNDPACFKILRRWQVIDWCQVDNLGNPAEYTHTQVIKVMDTEDPVMTCPPDTIYAYVDATCMAQITIDTPAVVDCSTEIDFFVSGNLTNTFGLIPNIPIGSYSVTISAVDACRNTGECTFEVIVLDTLPPTPVSKTTSTPLGDDGNGGGAVITFARATNVSSYDNCTPSSELKYSYSPDINDTTRTYTCDDLGPNIITFWVTDEYGNQDYVEDTIIVQDPNDWCGGSGSKLAISGKITNNFGAPVANVQMGINGSLNGNMITDNDGAFGFDDLDNGGDFTLVPEKDDDIRNGVSTYDLSLISRHVLNVERFTTPYQYIAADANNSGKVTTLDLLALRKLILHVTDELPNNTSWRFVDADYVFPNSSNPWQEPFPEIFNVNDLDHNMVDKDFIAIKIGDINGNAKANSLSAIDNRSSGETLNFISDEAKFGKGEQVFVDFYASDFKSLIGYQFTLNFLTENLRFDEIISGSIAKPINFGLTAAMDGIITTSWNAENATHVDEGEVLFTLVFNAIEEGTLSENIWVDGSLTTAEAYDVDGLSKDVQLKFRGDLTDEVAQAPFKLYQNEPNPFSKTTTIRFVLPEATTASLVISDVSGKIIKVIDGDYAAGTNMIKLTKAELNYTGVLYYRLQTNNDSAIMKMLLME